MKKKDGKKATMSDVAKLAGVSQSTVSLILNKKKTSFSQDTIDRVHEAADELNYQRHPTMIKETQGINSKSIMVIAVKMANPYYSVMLQSIENNAVQEGYHVISCNTYHNKDVEEKYLNIAIEQNYAGVIFLYPPDNLDAFHQASKIIPVIAICDKTSKIETDIVELNNFKAGELAAEHLIELGHKNLALLTLSPEGNTARIARINGIKSVMEKHNLLDKLTIQIHESNSQKSMENISYDYEIGYSLGQVDDLYKRNITAFICINDMIAYGLIEALHEKGYKIPQDYSIISFDNLLYSNFSSISLSTIHHHLDMVGRYAISVLLQKVNDMYRSASGSDNSARFKVECPPSLIVRNSTKKIM